MKYNKQNTNYFYNMYLNHFTNYPTPRTLSYGWNFGSILTAMFVILFVTGIMLATYYTCFSDKFYAVQFITREVNNGSFVQAIHSNAVSIFFVALYLHIARGLYYKLFKYNLAVWILGVFSYILSLIVAFCGYVLPWSQTSYWGATVIVNTLSVVPVVGSALVELVLGDFSVSVITLNRFFVIHFLFALLLGAVIALHIAALHHTGSSSPLGIQSVRFVRFGYYYFKKDLFVIILILFFLIYVAGTNPDIFVHYDLFNRANALLTPEHIVPEWYFLPFYALLRAFDNKTIGILASALPIIILLLLPFTSISYQSIIYSFNCNYSLDYIVFYMTVYVWITLGFIGGMAPSATLAAFTKNLLILYFLISFIVILISNISYKYFFKSYYDF